jgi:hypothetical protein
MDDEMEARATTPTLPTTAFPTAAAGSTNPRVPLLFDDEMGSRTQVPPTTTMTAAGRAGFPLSSSPRTTAASSSPIPTTSFPQNQQTQPEALEGRPEDGELLLVGGFFSFSFSSVEVKESMARGRVLISFNISI